MKLCITFLFLFCTNILFAQSFLEIQNGLNTHFRRDLGYNLNISYIQKIKNSKGYWGIRSANQWNLFVLYDDVISITEEDTYSLYGMLHETTPLDSSNHTLDSHFGLGGMLRIDGYNQYFQPSINFGLSLHWKVSKSMYLQFPNLDMHLNIPSFYHQLVLSFGAKFDLTKQKK